MTEIIKNNDVVFDSEVETYLSENNGNLVGFYRNVAGSMYFGQSFYSALSMFDRYRLRLAEKGDELVQLNTIDAPQIISAIEYLRATKDDYPENHPLRSM